MDLTEKNYEEIDKIIRSAVDRTVHSDILKREIITTVNEAVKPAIKEHVNGKIDRMTQMLMEHIERESEFQKRVGPVVLRYEEDRILSESASNLGKKTIFVSAVLASVGSLLFFVKELLKP
jgi:hypothetical protein